MPNPLPKVAKLNTLQHYRICIAAVFRNVAFQVVFEFGVLMTEHSNTGALARTIRLNMITKAVPKTACSVLSLMTTWM